MLRYEFPEIKKVVFEGIKQLPVHLKNKDHTDEYMREQYPENFLREILRANSGKDV